MLGFVERFFFSLKHMTPKTDELLNTSRLMGTASSISSHVKLNGGKAKGTVDKKRSSDRVPRML